MCNDGVVREVNEKRRVSGVKFGSKPPPLARCCVVKPVSGERTSSGVIPPSCCMRSRVAGHHGTPTRRFIEVLPRTRASFLMC